MVDVRKSIATFVFRHRILVTGVVAALTVFFAAGLPNVTIKTIFSDLLPVGNPFAETFRDHPNFGNPLTVSIMVKRKDGDIYSTETLQKVWDLTRDIDLAPAVDHDQVLSITTPKARYAEATPFGIDMRPLMGDEVPQTAEGIADFKSRVNRSPNVRGFLVSPDGSATLIQATFIEQSLDYGETFEFVQNLVEEARDENHEIHAAGQPMLTGWVYRYQFQMLLIFGVTLAALFIALFLYMRNVAGVVTPFITGVVSAVWGFGFVGWLDLAVEPLLLLVPLLLVARAFSHTVQYIERFYEILSVVKDKDKAGEIALRVMMGPGTLGIITDAAAILLIIIAPVPAMQRFALFCGFWAMILIPTSLFLAPLILSALPLPRNLNDIVDRDGGGGGIHRAMAKFLGGTASLTYGKKAIPTGIVLAIFGAAAATIGWQIKVGNPVEGSSLLWQDSEFNVAVRQINNFFPGVNTLEIVLESKEAGEGSLERTARKSDAVHTMLALQDYMERAPDAPRATLSFADYLGASVRLYNGGDPRWVPLGFEDSDTQAAASASMMGSGPKAFSHVVDMKQQNATVSFWYKDNKQETVDDALRHAREAVEKVGVEHENFIVRLGSGTIALQQAVNDTVEANYWEIVLFLNLMMFVLASFAFKSFIAALILLVPVNMSNFVIVASMSLMGVGLDINSVLVAAVGVGVGIDYGIYLLARIVEEYDNQEGDFGRIIHEAVTTTGRAIAFTATIMLIGIMPWYFLSGLKFLADMGLLLGLVMLINMMMSLLVLPLLIWFIKPKFVQRNDLIVCEHVDLSRYQQEG
ncbi:MMPL family transporter [Salinisphaera sp. P385]|uniref:MMPL family transporter n=1 Tax=Spectribacter acetivorans TaxID=3075603 RepID=A0ABU3B3T3_9GAMM|nr:MMPL family transporter [Salinisphaera sp. P385]MDT0617127.1 MMPL family transporter [Salinisphaera sp. P385]